MFKVTPTGTGQAGMLPTLSSESGFRAGDVRATPPYTPRHVVGGVGVVAPTSRMHRSLLVTITLPSL